MMHCHKYSVTRGKEIAMTTFYVNANIFSVTFNVETLKKKKTEIVFIERRDTNINLTTC